jgi:hypothetical protein
MRSNQFERASSSRRILGELLALGLHDVGRGVLDEAFIREHLLRPFDLLAQSIDLGGGVPTVDLRPLRLDDGGEDPFLLAARGVSTPLRRNRSAAS